LAIAGWQLLILPSPRNGHQPMADIDEKMRIAFNGEMYNYPKLRKELLSEIPIAVTAGYTTTNPA